MARNRFPTFAMILLLVGVVWLLNEVGILKIDYPWMPSIIIIIAIGMIVNRIIYKK